MKPGNTKTAQLLRKLALSHSGVSEGVACAGTKLESLTFNAGKKAFLFVHVSEDTYTVRLKLGASLSEAQEMAAKQPQSYQAATGGWAKLIFAEAGPPPVELLKRWIAESHQLSAPKAKAAKKTPR
jgi:predicted DNA-binding protein (MmcQ/YjbR family)